MATPRLFFGEGGDDAVLLYDPDAATDDGVAIGMRGRSQALALAGDGGEIIVPAVYLVFRHTMETTITLTPYLDDIPQDGTNGTEDLRHTIALAAAPRLRRTRRELALSVPIRDPLDRVVGRVAPRCSRFALALDAPIASGYLELEGCEIEVEAVEETLAAEVP